MDCSEVGPREATPCPRSGAVAERSYPTSKGEAEPQSAPSLVFADCIELLRKEQPHIQGAVAAWAQEGREELLHIQGQEG